MKVIGLTGGIASGKSTIARFLRSFGAVIVDADVISKELSEPGNDLYLAILHTFGIEYRDENGRLNRKKLGEYVFSHPEEVKRLNRIAHPLIRREIAAQIEMSRLSKAPAVIVDAPLLLESGMQDLVDQVWLAELPEEEQLDRAMTRDGLTREQVLLRMAAQWPLEAKKKCADVCISTTGTIEQTRDAVRREWIARVCNENELEAQE